MNSPNEYINRMEVAWLEDERSLLRKVQKNGNHAAADALVRKYYDEIFRFIRKQIRSEADAIEITQEAFIGLFRTIHHYDAKPLYKL